MRPPSRTQNPRARPFSLPSRPSGTEPSRFSLLSSLFPLLSLLLFSQIPLRDCHFDLCMRPSTARHAASSHGETPILIQTWFSHLNVALLLMLHILMGIQTWLFPLLSQKCKARTSTSGGGQDKKPESSTATCHQQWQQQTTQQRQRQRGNMITSGH